jgi:adenylate cyclase
MTIFPATASRLAPAVRQLRWLLPLLALLITVAAQWQPHGYLAEEWLRDRYLRLRTTDAEEPRILVVDVDEASLATLGPWPWPSSRIADLVEILLADYQARGVALDIVLPKAGDAAGDARLAALAAHGPLVLAQALDYSQTRPELLREGVLGGAMPQQTPAAVATGYIANHALLAQSARHIGNIGFIPDADGALRRLPLLSRYGQHTYPALSLALVNCCGGGLRLPPAGDAAAARVAYRRDWTAYTVVSAADILRHGIAPDGASGRLVLVGSSSLTLSDRVTTPLAASRPGLGVQAAMLSTLLDRRDGSAPAPWPGRWLACLYMTLVALVAGYTLPRLSATRNVLLLAGAALVWLGLAWLITPHDDLYSPTAPLASLLFLLTVAVPYQWQQAQHRSRHLLDTLRQYVAPAVVTELLRSDLKDPLAPRQLDVTTLVADMEGYTRQVEALPVDEAARLTRAFLECLTGPVIASHGTLDKYTGDGMMAFWGAPLPNLQHADLALDAARAIVQRVHLLSQEQQARGYPPLRVRIGIDSGLAMAGDFGTAFRSIYTAVGDSVNTAARLEQAARDYPHDVIIGAGTVERARRHQFQRLGERLLRGKEKPTVLYTFDTAMTVTADKQIPAASALAGEAHP